MFLNLDNLKHELKTVFNKIKQDQSDILAMRIATYFTAGKHAASKNKSFSDPKPLSDLQKQTIQNLSAEYFGYLSEFNDQAFSEVMKNITEIFQNNGGDIGVQESVINEIQDYLDSVFTGQDTITIDRTGQTKSEVQVTKDMRLVEKPITITRPYSSTLKNYAEMLGRTASHKAYETGRKAQYLSEGYGKWVFTGPADERSRPWHVAVLGQVFTYNTPQSEMAETLLGEPNCRHRAVVYFDDPDIDTPDEKWQKLKDDAGLFWNEDSQSWDIQ